MQYFYSLLLFFAMVHLFFNANSLSNVELVFFLANFRFMFLIKVVLLKKLCDLRLLKDTAI